MTEPRSEDRDVEERRRSAPDAHASGLTPALHVSRLADALSPTNFLWTNPAALRKAIETRGASVAEGLRNFWEDVGRNGGKPRQVDPSAFRVGEDLAATPGKVVFRNELMELMTDRDFFPPLSTWSLMPKMMGQEQPLGWICADDLGTHAGDRLR